MGTHSLQTAQASNKRSKCVTECFCEDTVTMYMVGFLFFSSIKAMVTWAVN